MKSKKINVYTNTLLNKGFTLAELLAVMVVLSIILVIAIPIISNIIENAEVTGNERSIEMYASAVQKAVLAYKLEGNKNSPSFENLKLEYDGDISCDTSIIYLDGSIYLSDCYVNGEYVKGYTYGEKKYETVYFDVLKGQGCKQEEYEQSYDEATSDYLNSSTGYNGVQMSNKLQNSCLKFYIINYNDDTLDLLLDHNTTSSGVGWKATSTTISGPINGSALNQLKSTTSSWQGVEIPENYTLDQTESTSQANYTIDYTGYKARLITAQEVANITNAKNWDERTATKHLYFDTGTEHIHPSCKSGDTSECKYGWLYDRTHSTLCKTYGCLNNSDKAPYGYWTATASAASSTVAWYVSYEGRLSNSVSANFVAAQGVRPVITVKTSKVS